MKTKYERIDTMRIGFSIDVETNILSEEKYLDIKRNYCF